MANTTIGGLTVKITADSRGVQEGIDAAGSSLRSGAKQLRKSANQFGKWGAAGVLAVGGITAAMVKMNLTSIKELGNSAKAADMTVAAFQRGSFAAEKFGISQEKYGDILKDVNDRVGDFLISGAGPMVDFFEQIAPKVGITADAFKGLSGQEGMALYVKSLEDANVSQQEMTFFMEAMASDSTRLVPLFKDNAKALKEMDERAKELGIGLTDVQVAMAGLASDELSETGEQFKALTQLITIELSPILIAVSKHFTDLANTGGGAANYIADAIDGVVSVVGFFADSLHGLKLIFTGLRALGLGTWAAIGSGLEDSAKAIAIAIDGILGMANMAIQQLNKIPGVDIDLLNSVQDSDFIKNITADSEFLKGLAEEAKLDFVKLATQSLPSDKIKQFVAEARAEFEGLAAAVVEKEKEDKSNGEGAGTKTTSETQAFTDETESLLELMGLRFESAESLKLASLERERAMTKQAYDNGEMTLSEHSKKMSAIKQSEEDTKRAIVQSSLSGGLDFLARNSKKAQKIVKAVAIVNAVIAGQEAAVHSYNAGAKIGGPYVGAAFAALSIANTAGMIMKIKSGGTATSGSGGGGSSVGIGGSQGASSQQSPPPTPPQLSRTIDINLPSTGLLSIDQVRGLMEQINEQVGDGVQLNTGNI